MNITREVAKQVVRCDLSISSELRNIILESLDLYPFETEVTISMTEEEYRESLDNSGSALGRIERKLAGKLVDAYRNATL